MNRTKFIRPTPPLIMVGETDKIPDYLVDIVPAGLLSWFIRKRIYQHEEYAEDSGAYYPHVLFIAGNDNTERRIVKLCENHFEDFRIYTTTMERMLHGNTDKVWQDVDEFESLEWDEEPIRITLPLKLKDNESNL